MPGCHVFFKILFFYQELNLGSCSCQTGACAAESPAPFAMCFYIGRFADLDQW